MCLHVSYILNCNSESNRQCLDRRRLEEAHLKVCLLDVYTRYPGIVSTWSISTNLQESLDNTAPLYYEAFATKYAGEYYAHLHNAYCEFQYWSSYSRLFSQGINFIKFCILKIIH